MFLQMAAPYVCLSILLDPLYFGGHVGWSHILLIVTNAEINLGIHVSLRISFCFLWVKEQAVELLGCVIFLFLIFGGTSMLFPIVTL